MGSSRAGRKRVRGSIDRLPNGGLRVRVHAGYDAVTGKRHRLVEIIPPGPDARARAEAARTRMLNEVDERRNPRTSATVNQLLDRYLEMIDVSACTHLMYTRYLEKHVRPFIGGLKAGAVDPDVLDSLYPSSGAAASTADRRAGRSTIAPRRRTSATSAAGRTCANRCRTRRSGTSTTS